LYKILRLNGHGKDELEEADFLAEYDAIVLDPSWALFRTPPGQHHTWSQVENNVRNFRALKSLLDRRSGELWPFFAHGGILVVRLEEAARLQLGGFPEILNSFDWWYGKAAAASSGALPGDWRFIQAASGPGHVLEPGHPFESYLRTTTTYRARLIGNHPGIIALAENRASEPVAAEVECQPGALFMVPPPASEGAEYMLDAAVSTALQSRLGIAHEWTVAEENVLADQRDAVLREMRERRQDVEKKLATTRAAKEAVLGMLHVDRVIGKYRMATNGTPVAKVAIPALWNMNELLREHYTKGTSTLASMLGVPKADLEFLDLLANNRDLDLRHTTTGQPKPVEPAELQRALAIGRAVVQAVIEFEYKRSTVAAVPVPANGERKASP
jgi:hypothetical protein